jgi:hypothetical protein
MAAKQLKLRKPSPHAAYVVADGLSAEEAEANGLILVEIDASGVRVFGRYEQPVE